MTAYRIRFPWYGRLRSWFQEDEPRSVDAAVVPRRHRLAAAVAIGIVSGGFTWLMAMRPGAIPDFVYPHAAIRLFLHGQNPYLVLTRHAGAAAPYDGLFFFPFTTVLAALPFAPLPLPLASGLFFGLASTALAYAITRDGLWRVHVFASAPFVAAAVAAQYAPLVMLVAFMPNAGWLATLKPNLGIALLARRPYAPAARERRRLSRDQPCSSFPRGQSSGTRRSAATSRARAST